MKIEIKITRINLIRYQRGADCIETQPFEDGESQGLYWNSPKGFKRLMNIKAHKIINLEDFRDELERVGVKI